MGQASRKKREQKSQEPLQEGLLSVRFVFNKKVYKHSHHMTGFELGKMMEAAQNHGDAAMSSAYWRVAVWGAGSLGEKVMLEAARDYIKQQQIPEEGHLKPPAPTVFDDPAEFNYVDMLNQVGDTSEDQDATE